MYCVHIRSRLVSTIEISSDDRCHNQSNSTPFVLKQCSHLITSARCGAEQMSWRTVKLKRSFSPVCTTVNPRESQARALRRCYSFTLKSLIIGLALGASTVVAQSASHSLVSRRLTEYLMPVAVQTHEFARVPNTNFVLLTQMSDSKLIKIQLDEKTEEPIAYQSFPMGNSSATSMLHGVWPSAVYPGLMWLSLQGENKLLLVDPGKDLSTTPIIKKTINIPAPGNGPHCVFEIGNQVWAGLKVPSKQNGKYYVFSADVHNSTNYHLYTALNSPVFIAKEPTTGLVYVT